MSKEYIDESESEDQYSDQSYILGNQGSDKKRRPVLAIGLIGLVAIVFVTYFYLNGKNEERSTNRFAPQTVQVSVDKVTETIMSPSTILPGTVISMRDATIAAETSGKITSVPLVGDAVVKGQIIASIDDNNARQLVTQRKADLARLQSLYQYHKDYFARVNLDNDRLGIPEIGIAELRSNMETAKADVARAKASLALAQTDLERTQIRAPFPGRVVSLSIQLGEYAQIGSSIARLVDTESLEVSAQVPAALVQPLESGTQLHVTGLGRSALAPLRALVPVGDTVSRTMELRVSLPNSDFLVGSPVRVTLPTAEPRKALVIPRDAIILRTNSQYIFVIDDEKKAHKREIELGYAQDDLIEVIGDVNLGDTVIIRGGERLRDGQVVKWSNDSADSEQITKTEG